MVAGCDCAPAASASGLALLGRLGIEFHFNKNHRAFLQYTTLNLNGPKGSGAFNLDYDNKWIGAASIGYRYVF